MGLVSTCDSSGWWRDGERDASVGLCKMRDSWAHLVLGDVRPHLQDLPLRVDHRRGAEDVAPAQVVELAGHLLLGVGEELEW